MLCKIHAAKYTNRPAEQLRRIRQEWGELGLRRSDANAKPMEDAIFKRTRALFGKVGQGQRHR